MDEEAGRGDSQVETQLLRLDKAIEGLCATIGLVDERLDPVLRRMSLETGKDPEGTEQHLVAIAESIRSHRRRVQVQTDRLHCMLSRIEL